MIKTTEILIIGAGAIGLSCAWRLAQKGLSVTVLERHTCGSGSSLASLGALYPPPPSREKPLQNIYRACLWKFKDFADEIEQETGIPIGYERRGRLEGILKESQKTKRLQECTLAEQKWQQCFHQPPMQMISATEARQIEPNVIPTEHGALLCHVTAQVNPQRMLSALRKVCELRQVRILENIPVHTLNLVQDRIQGVQTGQGIIPATTVLICAGAWSAQLHPILQRFTNILPLKGQAMRLQVENPLFSHIIMYGPFYLIRTSDTEIILGSTTEPEAGFDDQVIEEKQKMLFSNAVQFLPGLAQARIINQWAGIRPASARRKPYIGPVPGVEGLFIAAGHGKIGIGMAPKTGEWIAEMITAGKMEEDITSLFP
ncbi:MAG: NAD(P)/FAD-dependent oxidoreductase [bacterium]